MTVPRPLAPPEAWTFAVGPWGTAPAYELPTITGRSVTWRLDGTSEAGFTIDGRLPEAAQISELVSDLRVYRNGAVVFRGRVGATSDSVTADAHTVTVNAADYRAALARQLLYDTDSLTFNNQTDVQIVTAMLGYLSARPNGLQITVNANGGAGTTLSQQVFPAGLSIGEAVAQMSAFSPGFDWDVIQDPAGGPGLVLNMWFPRGTDNQRVIDYPGKIASFTRTVDPGLFANVIRASGNTSIAPVIAAASTIAADSAGRWDTQRGDTSLLSSGAVSSYATRQLALSQVITPAWVVTLNPDTWGGPADMWLGDPVTLSVQSGRVNFVGSLRVFEVQLTLDDASDAATVALTLGAVNPNRRWRLRNINRRLTVLERR